MGEGNLPFDVTGRHRFGIIGRFRRLIHHGKHPLRPGQSGKDGGHLLGQFVDRAAELPRKVHKYRQTANIKAPQGAQHAAHAGR